MFLYIFESLGTMELLLIAVVALVVFGPRKLPTMARKAGSMMRELRSVSNDFRTTWEREIDFEEKKSLQTADEKAETNDFFGENVSFGEEFEKEKRIENQKTSETEKQSIKKAEKEKTILPEIKELSEEDFRRLSESRKKIKPEPVDKPVSEKSEWL